MDAVIFFFKHRHESSEATFRGHYCLVSVVIPRLRRLFARVDVERTAEAVVEKRILFVQICC